VLKQIAISNFQSHKYTKIVFTPGVNAIVGRSMTGKTAILRALRWVVENRPTGFRFKRHDADKPTSVTIETMEGYRVTLRKTANNSTYVVKDPEGNINRFSKFGTDVPDLVKEVLNISEINLQKQLDAPFLITSSGGEIAKAINRITKADDADKWVSELGTAIRDARRDVKTIDNDIDEIKEELSELDGLDDVKSALEKAKKTKTESERASGKWIKLEKLKRELEAVVEKLYIYVDLRKVVFSFKKAQAIIDELDLKQNTIQTADALRRLNSDLSEITSTLRAVDPQKAEIGHLVGQIERKKGLIDTIEAYLLEESILQITNEQIGTLIEDYTTLMKEHKICPTCFRKIDTQTVNIIAEGVAK